MKKVSSPLKGLLIVALLCSCSPQDILETSKPSAQSSTDNFRLAATVPGNKANPVDFAGESYRELLTIYQSGQYSPESLAAVRAIVDGLTTPATVTVLSEDATNDILLSDIIQSPETALVNILQQSGLSQNAKDVLSEFVDGFDSLRAKPFDTIYAEIISLENSVISSDSLTADDKNVVLTVTSIARHSLSNKCCEDTDWETSVGNIVAATAGALINTDLAVRYALITRIGEYELVPL